MANFRVLRALPSATAPGVTVAPAGPVAAASTTPSTRGLTVAAGATAAVVIVWIIALIIHSAVKPAAIILKDGVSAFALVYIVAQVIERLLEPLSDWVGDKNGAVNANEAAAATAQNNPTPNTLEAAANTQATVDAVVKYRTLVLWAVATGLGLLFSGGLGIYLINAITTTPVFPQWIDILITGTVIGGGTKPLHDLISNIQQAKQQNQNPPGSNSSPLS